MNSIIYNTIISIVNLLWYLFNKEQLKDVILYFTYIVIIIYNLYIELQLKY